MKLIKQKLAFGKTIRFSWLQASILFVTCIIFCVGGFFFWKQYAARSAKVIYPPEDEKTEVKALPPDVKKTLQPTTAEATFRVPILMYHYVEYVRDKKDTIRQLLDIVPAIFIEQIQTLQQAGYTFMTAAELGEVIDGTRQLPPKPILLTFDDGHRDFYTDVLPILEKYHVKATSYVISGFLGGSDFMTPEQVQEVAKSGLVDVGAHTVHHIALAKKPLATVQYELTTSKLAIEALIHKKVVSFAYPYGSFDKQAIQAVEAAGFTTAVSTVPGIDVNQQNRYFLYRLRPGTRTGKVLLNWLSQSTFAPW